MNHFDQRFPVDAPKSCQEGWLDAKAGLPIAANPYGLGRSIADVLWTQWLAGHYLFTQGWHRDPQHYDAALALADETRAVRPDQEWAQLQRNYIADETRSRVASHSRLPGL